jgi:DNA-binding MltR family transcriptional regulator
MSDEKALGKLKEISGVKSIAEFQLLEKTSQGEALAALRKKGVSQRQLARLSGLSRAVVVRLCKNANI